MFSTRSFAAATAAFSLIASSAAVYDANSKANVAMYWGQGAGQAGLATYCDESTVDIIPIAFLTAFPPQGNGYAGANYGNQCGTVNPGTYPGPGYNGAAPVAGDNLMPLECAPLQRDINYCQKSTNKKILISLGGQSGGYALNNAADGVYLANWLWGAYGPYNQTWVDNGGIRPLDRGFDNKTLTDTVDVDGFDFDIEHTSADAQLGYVACIQTLRAIFTAYKKINPCSKDYLISGAPQCPLTGATPQGTDANMGIMINLAQFDILWIQFYNNDGYGCSAVNYTTQGALSNFNLGPGASGYGVRTYGTWVSAIAGGASKNAKLYIGLLGGPTASSSPQDWLVPADAKALIDAYIGTTNFGGVMLWEATAAAAVDMSKYTAVTSATSYWAAIKGFLKPYAPTTTVTSSTQVCTSTTSSSSSSTRTSSSTTTTSSSVRTTSTSSSTSSSATSTSSSTSSSTTRTSSSTSSSSSSTRSSTTSSSTSSSLTSSSTSTSSPTTSSTSSSSTSTSSRTSSSTTSSSTSSSLTSSSTSTSSPTTSSSSSRSSSSSSSTTSSTSSSLTSSSTSTSSPTTSSSSSRSSSSSSSTTSSSTSSLTSSSSSSTSSTVTPTSSTTTSSSTTSSTSSTISSSSSLTSSSVSLTSSTSSSTYSATPTTTAIATCRHGCTTSNTDVTSSSSTSSVTSTSSSTISTTSVSSTSIISLPAFTNTTLTLPPTSTSTSVSSTSSSTTIYTTSTVKTTSVYTITSCAATVTDCPARIGQVTTEVITLYTTVCPVTATETNGGSLTYSTMAPPPSTTQYTTSTVYTTKVYTVTSCAPTVTDCPAKLGSVTTEVIKLYTTVCPVAEATSAPVKAVSSGGVKAEVVASSSSNVSHTTKSLTTTLYKTIVMVKSTATVVPTAAPYPTGSASSKPFGTGLPSVSLVFEKQSTTSTAAGAAATKSAVPTTFTGAASSSRGGMGVMIAVILGAFALLM